MDSIWELIICEALVLFYDAGFTLMLCSTHAMENQIRSYFAMPKLYLN